MNLQTVLNILLQQPEICICEIAKEDCSYLLIFPRHIVVVSTDDTETVHIVSLGDFPFEILSFSATVCWNLPRTSCFILLQDENDVSYCFGSLDILAGAFTDLETFVFLPNKRVEDIVSFSFLEHSMSTLAIRYNDEIFVQYFSHTNGSYSCSVPMKDTKTSAICIASNGRDVFFSDETNLFFVDVVSGRIHWLLRQCPCIEFFSFFEKKTQPYLLVVTSMCIFVFHLLTWTIEWLIPTSGIVCDVSICGSQIFLQQNDELFHLDALHQRLNTIDAANSQVRFSTTNQNIMFVFESVDSVTYALKIMNSDIKVCEEKYVNIDLNTPSTLKIVDPLVYDRIRKYPLPSFSTFLTSLNVDVRRPINTSKLSLLAELAFQQRTSE